MGIEQKIKRILREELLNERLVEVDQDVDMIYDKFFKDDVEKLNKKGFLPLGPTFGNLNVSPPNNF